jgi:hypothetical protein
MSETKTHWKKMHNSDYLGAYSLDEGKDLILTIKNVAIESVKNERGLEDCVVARFVEKQKPMILNKTNSKLIQKIYKTPYIEEWANVKIQVYVAQVKFKGEVVEGLRIRDYEPKIKDLTPVKLDCEMCSKKIEGTNGLTAEAIARATKKKYGDFICSECAISLKTKLEETKNDTN